MLYSVINQKGEGDFVRVGIVAKNNNNEIMLVNENIDRINKSIINIPYVDVKEFKEENIIRELNNKYGIRIENLNKYINETSFLDEMCNERLQVNMSCTIDENNISNVTWSSAQGILINNQVPEDVKECIEVYDYNFDKNI